MLNSIHDLVFRLCTATGIVSTNKDTGFVVFLGEMEAEEAMYIH